jgi:transposase
MAYNTDLSDAEWNLIKNDFEPASKRGNGHKHDKKSIVDAILYSDRQYLVTIDAK